VFATLPSRLASRGEGEREGKGRLVWPQVRPQGWSRGSHPGLTRNFPETVRAGLVRAQPPSRQQAVTERWNHPDEQAIKSRD